MSQHCVSLNIIDDQRRELAESFFLTVSGGRYITVPADPLEFVIIDNDSMFGFLDAYTYSNQRSSQEEVETIIVLNLIVQQDGMCCIPFACSYGILMKGTKLTNFSCVLFQTDVLVYFRGPFSRSVGEDSGEVMIELVVEGESDENVTVTVRSRDGTATGQGFSLCIYIFPVAKYM